MKFGDVTAACAAVYVFLSSFHSILDFLIFNYQSNVVACCSNQLFLQTGN